MCWAESSVLSVAHFEPTEIAFQPVGGTRDGRVFEVMEHVGQSMNQETAGAFEVAEDVSLLWRQRDFPAVALLPSDEVVEPVIAVRQRMHVAEMPKQAS